MRPMRRRHVRRHRGVPAYALAARVAGHPIATQQQLDRASRQPRLQRLAHQRLRHAVAMPGDLHVIVDVDLHRLEARHLVAPGR